MIKRIVAVSALCVLSAAARAEVIARGDVTLTGSTVTVGDVFDGAGDAAERFLAPAPSPDRPLTLGAADLKRVSDAFGLGWRAKSSAERVVIHAPFEGIDRYAVEAALQERLSEAAPGHGFEVMIDGGPVSIALPAGADRSFQVKDFSFDTTRRSFTARLTALGVPEKAISGRVALLTEIPVLKAPARAGDVISSDDISYVEVRADELPATAIVDAADLLGRAPRRGIPALKPVSVADVIVPPIVKKGELVTIALQDGAISLTLQGRAMQNGGEGDVIRVVNTGSNKIVDGIVTGAQAVRVRPSSSAL